MKIEIDRIDIDWYQQLGYEDGGILCISISGDYQSEQIKGDFEIEPTKEERETLVAIIKSVQERVRKQLSGDNEK